MKNNIKLVFNNKKENYFFTLVTKVDKKKNFLNQNKKNVNSNKNSNVINVEKNVNSKSIDNKQIIKNKLNIITTKKNKNSNIYKLIKNIKTKKNLKNDAEIIHEKDISNIYLDDHNKHDSLKKVKTIIKCVDIEKEIKTSSFSSVILKNINLEINEGEIVIILGPSGSGKTTLLNIIASIDKPSKGNVYIDGVIVNKLNDKKLTELRKNEISYIYQRYGLIPISTVFDNIKLGQNLVKKENRKIDFDMVIEKTGLKNYLSKFPHEISGGQKQRVAIARAILKQPRLMLCDEPTGALDEETSKKIIDLFLMVNKEYKTTIVMVTHNNDLVSIANKVIYIKDGSIERVEYKQK